MEITFMGFFYRKCSWEKAQVPISSSHRAVWQGIYSSGIAGLGLASAWLQEGLTEADGSDPPRGAQAAPPSQAGDRGPASPGEKPSTARAGDLVHSSARLLSDLRFLTRAPPALSWPA